MDATAHALGRLEGKVDQLISNQRLSDGIAREGQKQTNEKLEDLLSKIHQIDKRMETAESDLAEIKPFVESQKAWHQRSIGALAVVGGLSGSVGGVVVYYKEKLFSWLTGT